MFIIAVRKGRGNIMAKDTGPKVWSLEEVAVKNTIIEQFNGEELLHKPLIDFLPYMVRTVEDEEVLTKWMKFFRSKDVPYIITEDKHPNGGGGEIHVKKLWKERYVDDKGEKLVLPIVDDPIIEGAKNAS